MKYLLGLLLALVSNMAVAMNVFEVAHETTLKLDFNDGHCSGTAVGPHLVLSAAHCFETGTDRTKMLVNGEMVQIVKIVSDDSEHVLILTTGHLFQHYAHIANRAPRQTEFVFLFGNPEHFDDLFRIGHIASFQTQYGFWFVDMNVGHGDSGAAIFDQDGKILSVLSILTPGGFQIAGAMPMLFTPKQIHDLNWVH